MYRYLSCVLRLWPSDNDISFVTGCVVCDMLHSVHACRAQEASVFLVIASRQQRTVHTTADRACHCVMCGTAGRGYCDALFAHTSARTLVGRVVSLYRPVHTARLAVVWTACCSTIAETPINPLDMGGCLRRDNSRNIPPARCGLATLDKAWQGLSWLWQGLARRLATLDKA